MIDVNIVLQRGVFKLAASIHSDMLVTGLFGPSGAGKSSLLQIIAGLVKPQQGYIRIGDTVLYDSSQRLNLPSHQRGIGYVFQDALLFPHLSVKNNLLYGYRRLSGKPESIVLDDVVALLEISHLLAKNPQQLSGGEKQRVALGRALLSNPRLLLLDEPMAALDERLKQQILPFLLRVRDELHLPMLYVSHSLAEIQFLTDHIVFIEQGQIRNDAETESF